MPAKITYIAGQVVGPHGVRFVQDVPSTKKYIRMALFECPDCGAHFECKTGAIQSGNTRSCSCQGHPVQPRTKYTAGDIVGDSGMVFVQHRPDLYTSHHYADFTCGYCGKLTQSQITMVKNGKTKSCGCLVGVKAAQSFTKHAQSQTRLYRTWAGMIVRCSVETNSAFSHYGARGISVCEDWKVFTNFHLWATNSGYSDTLTIERKDVNGNYCPENCCWIPQGEQARNTRIKRWCIVNGELMRDVDASMLLANNNQYISGIRHGSRRCPPNVTILPVGYTPSESFTSAPSNLVNPSRN
jgi:transcription elongation factor Elf1